VLHFDFFPTILALSGFQVEGGKLGLGYSAITPGTAQPNATILEDMQKDLLNASDTYNALWKQSSKNLSEAKP